MEYREQVYRLWRLPDDIDAATDIFKEDYKAFQNYASRISRERFKVVPEDEVDELYNKYYTEEL